MFKYDNTIPKESGIYRIKNTVNGRSYIGSSVNILTRMKRHCYELEKSKHNNKHMQRAYDKYGPDSFHFSVVELLPNIEYSELLDIEKSYIIKENLIENGFNQMIDNSDHFSKMNKTKKHIDANKERDSIPVIGFDRFTGEKIKEFSSITEASYFIKTSTSNISRVCKGELNYIKDTVFCYSTDYNEYKDYSKDHYKKGEKHSQDHYNAIKLANQKRLGKAVYQYTEDLIYVAEYPSMSQAEKKNGLGSESLRRRLDKTPFEGFYWKSSKL